MTYSLEGVVRIEATDTVFTGNTGKPRTSYGSGFLIDGQHVMTALHVLFPDFKDPLTHSAQNWRATVFANVAGKIETIGAGLEAPLMNEVVSNPLDVAVLKLDRALALRPLQVSRRETNPGSRYESFGYPGYSESNADAAVRRGPGGLPFQGTIGEVRSDRFSCLVEPPPRPDSFRDWRSLSGAPVVVNGWVVGVLSLATQGWTDVLHAIPTQKLGESDGISSLLPTLRSSRLREYVREIARGDEVRTLLQTTAAANPEWSDCAFDIDKIAERLFLVQVDLVMSLLNDAHRALEGGRSSAERREIGRSLCALGSTLVAEVCPIRYDLDDQGRIQSVHSVLPWSFEVGVAAASNQPASFRVSKDHRGIVEGSDQLSAPGEMGPIPTTPKILQALGKLFGLGDGFLPEDVLAEARTLGLGDLKDRRHPFFAMDEKELSRLDLHGLGDLREAVGFVQSVKGSKPDQVASNAMKLLGDVLRRQDSWNRPR